MYNIFQVPTSLRFIAKKFGGKASKRNTVATIA